MSQTEPHRAAKTTKPCVCTRLHTHSQHLHWGWITWGSSVVSVATAQLICRWEMQESTEGDFCMAADLHAENISPAGTS